MRVIYYSPNQSLSPQIVAAIHLRLLPMDHYPSPLELQRLPYGQGFTKQDYGRLLLAGRFNEWEVYLMPLTAKTEKMVLRSLRSTLELTQLTPDVDLRECRAIPPPPRGKGPLNVWCRQYYKTLIRIVRETEEGHRQ